MNKGFVFSMVVMMGLLSAALPCLAGKNTQKKAASSSPLKTSVSKKPSANSAASKTLSSKKSRPAPAVKKPRWQTESIPVENGIETRYDANRNGQLEKSESRELLTDKLKLISALGKTGVETSAEREYDLDHDGYIDENEGKALKADLSS